MHKTTAFFVGITTLTAVVLPLASSAQTYTSTGVSTTVGSSFTVAPQYCPQLYGNLGFGSRGAQVSALQQYLNARYGNQSVTGYFGAATRLNVIRLQSELGISPVGSVGPITRGKLQQLCTGTGSSGGGTTVVSTSLSGNPAAGAAPLTVNFTGTVADSNTYIIDYGDGSNSGPLQATCSGLQPYPAYNDLALPCQVHAAHAYSTSGTYTAHLESYLACLWTTPRCMTFAAQKNLGQVIITVGSQNGGTTGSASLSANPSSGSAPLSVSFTGVAADSSQYIIEYGDGSTSGPIQSNCLNYALSSTYTSTASYDCRLTSTHTYASTGTYTASLERYIGCMWTNPRCMIAVQPLAQATVSVTSQSVGGITVTSPAAGATYARGQDMTITWSYPVTPNSVQMAIELYTAAGVNVGPIAISNATSGSYTWHIPGFPQNYMCTAQYPNGLCGAAIPNGQYYIRVSAETFPFDANPGVIAAGQSGVFTIYGAQ